MTKLPRKLATLFLLISFLAFYYSSLKIVHAQIPDYYGSCDEELDEYHSLRPYRARPFCNPDVSEEKLYCGNDLIVKKTFKVSPINASACTLHPDGSQTCQFVFERNTDVSIDLIDAELPIMGNTQLVTNSQEQSEVLDDAEKVNEYVSWYLNGVINRAEYDFLDKNNPEDIAKLINFSGPLNKLLPWEIQAQERIATIEKAGDSRHNQIVGCRTGPLSGSRPSPCYGDSPTEVRLTDWDGAISPEFLTSETTWNKRVPPLRKDFDDFQEYQKAYWEWRGKSCVLIPIPFMNIKLLQCIDNPLRPNHWANLFPYVPLSSTEDRTGEVVAPEFEPGTDYAPIQSEPDGVKISEVKFEPDNDRDDIYFAHMEEVSELASLLQATYKAKNVRGFSGATGANEDFYEKLDHCDLADVRWNSGDDLLGEVHREGYNEISGTLSYKASFSCTFSPPDPFCIHECRKQGKSVEECNEICASASTCKKDAYVAMAVYTRTPKVNEVWDRLVAGSQSIFKRIYSGAILEKAEIKDYPAVTTAHYDADDADEVLAGNPNNKRSGERAEIFIPHVGGIQEYFLKGIQKALRPQGFTN